MLCGYNDLNGIKETEDKYKARMCAYVSFFAGIVQSDPISFSKNPFGIENGWRWMASILNISQRSITPSLLCSFLEVQKILILL